MGRTPRSIRSKIILALVVPVVALSGMWGLDVRDSMRDALTLWSAGNTRDEVGLPCARVIDAFQAERSMSQEFLATGRREVAELHAQRAVTDAAVADFRRLSARYDGAGEAADLTRARIRDLTANLDTLTRLRTQIDAGTIARAAVLNGYSGLLTNAFGVLTSVAYTGQIQVERIMQSVVDTARLGELFAQEDALLTGATSAGRFDDGEYLVLLQIVGAQRFQVPTVAATLPEDVLAQFRAMFGNPSFAALRAAEDRVIREGSPGGRVPITTAEWKSAIDPAARQLQDFVLAGYDEAVKQARASGGQVLIRIGIAGGLGLIAIVLSLVLSIRIGGSVVRRLGLLRAAATDLAGRRLPDVVGRLRAGEPVDVDGEALRPPPGDDEIAEVGTALAEVQRSAVESAVGEAALRRGMSTVLVNIARRNQGLVERQIEALRAPGAKLDKAEQLAVRMRRYAEHLVILAGSARGRGGLQPEPLSLVVAAAAGEVQDNARIEIGTVADAELPGRVAPDLMHLLAELMENATSFSPPHTPVRVTAERIGQGLVVQIEDRGLGMSTTSLEETNRRLAEPPDFDPANSARLGLYVVAVLAAQRGIQVGLRPSSFGGITAEVTVPPELVILPGAHARRTPATAMVSTTGAARGRTGPRS